MADAAKKGSKKSTKKTTSKKAASKKAASKKGTHAKAGAAKKPASGKGTAKASKGTRGNGAGRAFVPDTSVIVDGRVTQRIQRGELDGARIIIPEAVVAELEYQSNQGRESGFNGLDEIVKIQELRGTADISVEFAGERPLPEEIQAAKTGELDAMIRDVALDESARLLTSDRVQAHVARAIGLDVEYVRPITRTEESEADIESLEIMRYFTEDTMSVHLKFGVAPLAKRGTPGKMRLVKVEDEPLPLHELTRMRRELIEAAQRDAESFVEIERTGATVVQLRNMRIAIAQPPFSDGLEITAVRPVAKLTLEEYDIPEGLRERLTQYQRGVFVSGPPGSGKSTFVTAVAEWLKDRNTIVKTMESPRDLQVSDDITQYAPLDRSMALTSDVLLLVRPDYVIYDEVRKTDDFEIFADMRLAGVGLIGVTHANRAIDAVQRLIGRVELGMIPQVVDTVIHVEKGAIQQVMTLSFTVKVPHGMQEADLARPVIEVKDADSGQTQFEIYTYGEQVVVMPVGAAQGGRQATGTERLAQSQLKHLLRDRVEGPFQVEFKGPGTIALYVPQREVPRIIGKAGRGVQALEEDLGVKIDVRSLNEYQGGRGGRVRGDGNGGTAPVSNPAAWTEDEPAPGSREKRYATLTPEVRRTKKYVVLSVNRSLAGQDVDVTVDEEVVGSATVSSRGEVRLSRRTETGAEVMDALARGAVVTLRV